MWWAVGFDSAIRKPLKVRWGVSDINKRIDGIQSIIIENIGRLWYHRTKTKYQALVINWDYARLGQGCDIITDRINFRALCRPIFAINSTWSWVHVSNWYRRRNWAMLKLDPPDGKKLASVIADKFTDLRRYIHKCWAPSEGHAEGAIDRIKV